MNISNLQKIGFSETDMSLQIDAASFDFESTGSSYINGTEVTFVAPKEFNASIIYWVFVDGLTTDVLQSASGIGTISAEDIIKFSTGSLEIVEGDPIVARIAMGPPGIQGEQGVQGAPGSPGAPGEPGADGITVAVSVNGETYSHVGGLITLPDYPSGTSSLELGETGTTAYRGDRGKTAYDHSQTAHNKAFVGLGNVDNTSDANKPISSATATALSGKSDTSHLHTGVYAPALGTNDNYVTDAEKAALHAHSNKTALDAVSGTNTGDQTLSSLGAEPANANIQSHISSTSNPHSTTASQVGADATGTAASAVAAHNVSGTAHADLRPVYYIPATMTVNAGTLNAGTVADLTAVGGTDVSIQEASGANPLTVTFDFTDVTRLSNVLLYLDYLGGASHVVNCEIYNNTTAAWDVLGSFSTTDGKQWYSFEIFTPNAYINAGAVSMRLRHVSSGITSHQLIIDYVDINAGGGGGIGYVGAASVNFVPTGGIAATNVQTALAELDSEKMAATATLDNVPDGSTRVLPVLWHGTQAEYDAISPKVATTYYLITED